MDKYDAIIIGFGKGGKTLAGKLGSSGRKVALIEKSDKMYGGTCINVGCIPSKSLVRSAGLSRLNESASFEEKAAIYKKAIAEKRRLTSMLRKKNFDKLDQMEHVTVFHGTASFLSNTKVQVVLAEQEETLVLEGEKIFINAGAAPVIPPIPGVEDNSRVYFSQDLLDLEQLPKKLVIIGGGYIGLEFSSIYSSFGSEVTILQDGGTFLKREDQDIAGEIQKVLGEKGVHFLLGAKLKGIEEGSEFSTITVEKDGEEQKLMADAILVATGRKANTAGLAAEQAGVELTDRGAVKVDENLKTTAPNIWAMGDVKGGLQFTYVSLDDFRIIWSQMQDKEYNTQKRQNVPYSVFIEPSFSRVGLNEREALAAGYEIQVFKLPAAAIPKAQVLKDPKGMLKAIVDKKTDQILGAMLFCEESFEMINTVKLAMDLKAPYTVLKNQIFTHPTMSEALNDLFA